MGGPHLRTTEPSRVTGAGPESYLLHRCGTPEPEADDLEGTELAGADLDGVPAIEVPVESVFSGSTTHLPLFTELDRAGTATGVSEASFVSTEEIADRIEDGETVEYAGGGTMDQELVIADDPDLLMTGGAEDPPTRACKRPGYPWWPTPTERVGTAVGGGVPGRRRVRGGARPSAARSGSGHRAHRTRRAPAVERPRPRGAGPTPSTGSTGRLGPPAHAVVGRALDAVGAGNLAGCRVAELSDGERQRVLTARALAQEPAVLPLDVPTAFLDVPGEVALTGLLRRLARERDLAVDMCVHDLEMALRTADTVWLLDGGSLYEDAPEELALDGTVGRVFDGADLEFAPAEGASGSVNPPTRLAARSGPPWSVPTPSTILSFYARWSAPDGGFRGRGTEAGPGPLARADHQRRLPDRVPRTPAQTDPWAPSPGGGPAWPPGRTRSEPHSPRRPPEPGPVRATPTRDPYSSPHDERHGPMPNPHVSPDPSTTAHTARSAVADITRLGRFFDLTPHPDEADTAPGEGPWRPLPEMWGPDVLRARIENTRRLFAGRVDIIPEQVEPRVASSVLYQGLAARLVSPVMATAVVHGLVPEPAALRWRMVTSGPLPLLLAQDRAVPAPRPHDHGPGAAAETIEELVLQGLLEPAATAFRDEVKLSPKVLRGNIASSVAGAARRIEELRPEHGPAAHALAEALLSAPTLSGSGKFGVPRSVRSARSDSYREARFTRNSCCLYYRLPDGGKCADCVLLREAEPAR